MHSFDSTQTAQEIQHFLKKTAAENGFANVCVALSGGIDSATALTLCTRTFPLKNIFVVMMPYGKMGDASLSRGRQLVKNLAVVASNIFVIDIQATVDDILRSDSKASRIRKGNVMARVRMIYLYDIAKKYNALVVGTENRSEYLLGYFTRFGDEASDVEPLQHLYKTEVQSLAEEIGVPEDIRNVAPSADLWEGHTDEGELGFTYEQADEILTMYYDDKVSRQEIVSKSGESDVVNTVLERARANAFKHQTPWRLERKDIRTHL